MNSFLGRKGRMYVLAWNQNVGLLRGRDLGAIEAVLQNSGSKCLFTGKAAESVQAPDTHHTGQLNKQDKNPGGVSGFVQDGIMGTQHPRRMHPSGSSMARRDLSEDVAVSTVGDKGMGLKTGPSPPFLDRPSDQKASGHLCVPGRCNESGNQRRV
jgi:hypothetical protein